MSSLAGIALATAGFVSLYLIPNSNSELRNSATAALCIILALRFARLWWLFGRVLTALMAPPESANRSEPESGEWTRPEVDEGHYAIHTRRARRRG